MSIVVTASRMLAKYGESLSFTYVLSQGAYNPATGETNGDVLATITANGYPSQYKANDKAQMTIENGDIRLVCEFVTSRPEQGWNCTINNEIYRVVSVQTIRKSAKDIIYICQLRR